LEKEVIFADDLENIFGKRVGSKEEPKAEPEVEQTVEPEVEPVDAE
jgi:hypothetical protein